ncbi:MAG: cobyrinate a,c-diamide synthase [Syntrophobacter sp.]
MPLRTGRKNAFLIAGTHSGCGKTTITLGLLAAFRARGLKVQPFKVGPDFIDPGLHTQIAGFRSSHLDGWMLSRELNVSLFNRLLSEADLGLVEGVMGLFDGYEGASDAGSSAQMAKWLGIPVILVVDARSMARSAAALIYGFRNFDPDLNLAGVIFNRIGSPVHLQYLKEAIGANLPGLMILGGIPTEDPVRIPERHLGLVTADEMGLDGEWQRKLAELIERSLDLDLLLEKTAYMERPVSEAPHSTGWGAESVPRARGGISSAAGESRDSESFSDSKPDGARQPVFDRRPESTPQPVPDGKPVAIIPPAYGRMVGGDATTVSSIEREEALSPQVSGPCRATIGVARDAAFCFYYPENLELLENAGARLHFFSPISGECFPDECSGVYLGGGYPELFCEAISKNRIFLEMLRNRAAEGMPVYAECGGLMTLGRFIDSVDGRRVPMAGILPFGTRMLGRRRALGYTEVILRKTCLFGEPGMSIRGHEFHYSEIVGDPEHEPGLELAYELRARKFEQTRNEGFMAGSVLASYIHLHWGSAPEAARGFVDHCADWKKRKESI